MKSPSDPRSRDTRFEDLESVFETAHHALNGVYNRHPGSLGVLLRELYDLREGVAEFAARDAFSDPAPTPVDVRDLAAQICAIAASTPDLESSYSTSYSTILYKLGYSYPFSRNVQEAFEIALSAWERSSKCDLPDAEAEALIRAEEIS